METAVVVRSASGFGFSVIQQQVPEIGPSEILVRLSASGVCGTDLALASGEIGPTCDILGHEGVGHVVKIGTGVGPGEISLGDRVGIAWLRDICGKCSYCLHPGGETRCAEQLNSGRKIDGTFAEYAVVPARYIIRIPDSIAVSDVRIAPILCAGVTAYKALKICGATSGQWVLVSGAGGGVGALAIQYAKAMGFRIIAIDAGEPKRQSCLDLGAEVYLDVLAVDDLAREVNALTKTQGVSAALAIAGSGKAYQAAFELLGPYGTLVCVGIPPPHERVSFHPLQFIDKGIRIIGTAVGTRSDILEALGFVERGSVNPSTISIALRDLPEVAKNFGNAVGKYVIEFGEGKKPAVASIL
ncbi:alcohol dehydrogenase [Plenodomus tracheiphilus IPT5]|uniref:Alcohol dehydrogenase n=1 Tax=Plenodomus tracheiphilus IPT5 TaxID=1408161 RepID=A0A6A7AT46_9PLEO|nr:alcohol dehydrogenase [Plenodomus tracheiphilus IPT5]